MAITRTIVVSTVKEFVNAIGPNRQIIVNPGTYELRPWEGYFEEEEKENEEKEEALPDDFNEDEEVPTRPAYFEDGSLVIELVNDMQIVGQGAGAVKLLGTEGSCAALTLRECKDVIISGLEAGHDESIGECFGSAIMLENCTNVKLDRVELFGCGTYGLEADSVEGLTLANSTIRNCTCGIAQFECCNNVNVIGCTMRENRSGNMFDILECKCVSFNACTIVNNVEDEEGGYSLFEVADSENVTVENCTITDNKIDYLTNDRPALKCRGNTVVRNRIIAEFPPET